MYSEYRGFGSVRTPLHVNGADYYRWEGVGAQRAFVGQRLLYGGLGLRPFMPVRLARHRQLKLGMWWTM